MKNGKWRIKLQNDPGLILIAVVTPRKYCKISKKVALCCKTSSFSNCPVFKWNFQFHFHIRANVDRLGTLSASFTELQPYSSKAKSLHGSELNGLKNGPNIKFIPYASSQL